MRRIVQAAEMFRVREYPGTYVRSMGLRRLLHRLSEFTVPSNEPCSPERTTENVFENEDLAIACRTGPYANGRYRDNFRSPPRR